ncbi:SGNH/GDSL hydrolase family protein [Chitinophaga sedimenti]|uniref:SGNH/GDSL hydrolase family protein n=1 Tax=Chitinophaga sedimenti TaxID=2033606 RepID=UPI002005A3AA|nr:SGNH/GDSL hydrolase family protein [Chitinophaga sedimenti]MCK7558098.1 SGNH/GDSL hydrolase family protein [Chitinophaga sedimenti]
MKKIFALLLALTAGVSSIFAQTCTDKGFVVVVLGSSTAAGWDGPTERDSAWVSILTRNFQFINANYRVINLAVAGTTTYAAQPSWYTPPNGRPVPDTAKNITKALIGYQADAVIVNFPTNDAINSYTLAEQQANFQRIVASADSLHVPVWVTSTQPRTQMYGVSRQPLFDMRDWLLDRFRDRYIDFWSPFANADGSINTAYSHADGIHLNNTAHYIMAQRVFNEAIPDTMCAGPVRMPVFRGWYTSAGYADFLWHVGQRAVKHYQLQYQSGSTWYSMTGNIPMQQQPNSWMNYTASGIGAYPVRLAITDTKNRVFYTGSIQVPDASEVLISRMQAKNESGKMFLEWATSSEYQLDTMGVEYNLAGQWLHLVSGINAKGSRYDTASYRVELPAGFGAGTYRLHYSSWAGSIKYTASRQVTIYKEPSAVTMTRTGVTRINDTRILWWETANERNIRAYRLLRQEGNSWVYVDSVRSLGNGTRSYTYTDRAFRPYAVNYMIQPVDIYDSLFAYSYANTGIDLNTQRPVYRNPQYTAHRDYDVQKVDFSVADARNIAALTLQRKATGDWEHAGSIAFEGSKASYTFTDSVYNRLAIDYRVIVTSPYDKHDTLPVFFFVRRHGAYSRVPPGSALGYALRGQADHGVV